MKTNTLRGVNATQTRYVSRCRLNVGPASTTLAQYLPSIGSASRARVGYNRTILFSSNVIAKFAYSRF